MTGSVPSAIVRELESRTSSTVKNFLLASGGCINHGGCVLTTSGVFFLKWNDLIKFPGMFIAEARGLTLLRGAKALAVPRVILVGEAGTYQFLLLEYVVEGTKSRTFWRDFGAGLATLHRTSSSAFGLDHDNYIGSLAQLNSRQGTWVEFFVEQRLRVQLRVARDEGKLDDGITKKFEALFRKLTIILPEEPPSLLHGDLWGGNIMTSSEGKPCIIDPAVYYGHREMDLAMTRLFGGFDRSYVGAYQEVYPLLPDFEGRLDLYNLYPLLVHVNLFGGGYTSQVTNVLSRFV
jgi:protein-ribulosamine 3-kinase